MDRLDAASGVLLRKRTMIEAISRSTRWRKVNADLKDQNRKLRELAEHRSASIAIWRMNCAPANFDNWLLGDFATQEELTDAQRNFCERIQNSAHQLQNSLVQLGELSSPREFARRGSAFRLTCNHR
jgi:hypothetical protein